MVLRRVGARSLSGWNQSVLRRAILLLLFTFPAAALNLAFTYTASHFLSPGDFGIFYTAITAINILFAPATVVNLFFSRFVATAFARHGKEEGKAAVATMLLVVSKWIILASMACLALVGAAGFANDLFSPTVGTLIVVIVATSYFAECGRIILQGEHRFVRLGIYTLGWMTARFVFGLAGLWLFGTVWGALAGVVLSAPIIFILFFGISPFLVVGRRSNGLPQARSTHAAGDRVRRFLGRRTR